MKTRPTSGHLDASAEHARNDGGHQVGLVAMLAHCISAGGSTTRVHRGGGGGQANFRSI